MTWFYHRSSTYYTSFINLWWVLLLINVDTFFTVLLRGEAFVKGEKHWQNAWCNAPPGVRLESYRYVTFCTCMSARKLLKFVILCTNRKQIGILEVTHITVIIFTFNDWI